MPLLFLVGAAHAAPPLPEDLADTGFDEAKAIAFTPAFQLWTDGAAKRRWLALPPGKAIDTSRTDAWEFPVGTKAWKEFSVEGRKIETRFIERLADGTWRFATYLWDEKGTRATLAPAGGAKSVYPIPSRQDCLACHEAAPSPILGFSAVQKNPNLERTLGYLHANCGHCHNDSGPLAGTELSLAQSAADPKASAAKTRRDALARKDDLLRRIRSANRYVRMPPLGVTKIDDEGVALIAQWLQSQQKELSP